MKRINLKSTLKLFLMVQESIKHFPIPLRNWLKVLAGGQFLVIFVIGFAFTPLEKVVLLEKKIGRAHV